MSDLQTIRKPVATELEKFQPYFSNFLKSNSKLLNIIIFYLLKQKGKQIRPLLVFLSAKMFGTVCDKTYQAAAFIEMMHTASLVHDDVVDESDMRRGFWSINAIWKNKASVLLGDFLLAKGLLLAVDNQGYDLLQIVSQAVEEMSEGELLQMEKARHLNITEQDYYQIIRQKTAALMVACTKAGACSVGASESDMQKMADLGDCMGKAFQIRDDLFDYDASAQSGKPVGNDIIERKMTLPLIYSLNNCAKSDRRHIIKLMRKKQKSPTDVQQVIDFVMAHNGVEYARQQMKNLSDKALQILATLPQNEANQSLVDIVSYIVDRKK